MTATVARILLADDHPLVRVGLREVINRQPDLQVVAEAGDGAEAVAAALREEVDVAILDVAMPRLTGIQAAERLRKQRAGVRVLMLSMHDNDQYLLAAARAGAAGYVLKSVADEEVVTACRAIVAGSRLVYPAGVRSHTRDLVERVLAGERQREVLTPREREVVKLVAEGRSSAEIAELLVISLKTVETHRANVAEKLQARDRVELTRYAIRSGLVEP